MARVRKTETERTEGGRIVWRIGVYIRLSREDGEDESLSVINQKKIIIEYLERFFEGEYLIADFYIDDGNTGTDYDRPDFQRMLSDIRQGRINCIICKTLARAFRNYSDQGYFLESFFPQNKTRFISIGSPHVDSFAAPESISGLEVPITGLMNDRFAGRTSDDVRRTFDTKRRKGEYIGAFAPYGYAKDPKDKNSLIVDGEAARTVRSIFYWFVNEGLSKKGIARRLNERGLPNPTAYKRGKGLNYNNPNVKQNDGLWSGGTVARILKNKMYLGHMVQGRQRVVSYKVHDKVAVPEEQWFVKENTHEPIVAQELFDRAQDISKRDTRTANGKGHLHLFSGFLRCADCKKALHRKASKGLVYYACRTYTEKSKDRCARHSIREDMLEQAVLACIRAQIFLMEELEELAPKISGTHTEDAESKRINELLVSRRQEFERINNAKDSLYMDWKNGDISRDDYLRMKGRFEARAEQLTQVIAGMEEEKRVMDGCKTAENSPFTYFIQNRSIEKLDRAILAALVDTVWIHKDKKITVRFKYADQYLRLSEAFAANAGKGPENA